MGLKTQVKVFKGKFDKVSYGIGKRDNVVKAVEGFNSKFAEELKSANFGSNSGSINPEHSQNPRHGGLGGNDNNIVAIGTEATKTFSEGTKSTFEEGAAFLINHGTGHNANLQHAGQDNGYDDQGKYQSRRVYVPGIPNVITDGGVIVDEFNRVHLGLRLYRPILNLLPISSLLANRPVCQVLSP